MKFQLYAHIYDISNIDEDKIQDIEFKCENVFRSCRILIDVTENSKKPEFDDIRYLKSIPILDHDSMLDEVTDIFESYNEYELLG